MAILNFMPQFVPWSTKVLLKKKDDPDVAAATESTTGFFGDTFDFIDDAFDWTATAVEEPAIQYEEPPQYFDAPVAPPEPFYDVPPQYYDAPVQDTGFGSAIGDIFNGSGEGLGFDFIGEPTDSWTSQAPFEVPQADYNWDGGMGFEPAYVPPISDWVPAEPPPISDWQNIVADPVSDWNLNSGYDSWDFNTGMPATLEARYPNDQAWSDVQDWRTAPPDSLDTTEFDYNATGSAPIMGALDTPDPMGWDEISSMFNAARPEPTPAPQTWDIPGMENPNTGIPGWFSMTPDERGEYVWQSGLPAGSYLTDEDIAGMSDEVRFKLNFSDNERGNKSNWEWIKDSIIRPLDVANSNVFEPIGDAVVDPLLDPLTSTGNIISPLQPGYFSNGMSVDINLRGDTDNVDFDYPLDDTIANARAADNPWDFMEMQDENFKDRPMLQQIALQMLGPGNGLWKNIDALPGWLKTADNVADIAQGGFISDIPGAGGFVKNVALPFGIGAVGGAATEVAFDPKYEYTDPITGETKTIDPNMWQMATGFGTGVVLGKNALGRGLLPGNSIDEVGKILPFGSQKVVFEDPLDEALYIASDLRMAADNPEYLKVLEEAYPNTPPMEVLAKAEEVRNALRMVIPEITPDPTTGAKVIQPITRPVAAESIPTVPTPIRQAAVVEVPTVPSAITETPQERLVRLQQEVFASDPTAAAPFSAPGAVSPLVADEIPTVPTGIADEVVTPAPSTPLVDRVINHIDAITGDRADRGEATKKAYDTWKSNLYTEILAKNGGDTRRALAEWSAQVDGVTLETYAANMPTLKESEVDQIWDIINAKTNSGVPGMDYGAFSLKRMEKALNSLVDGVNGNPGDLAVLRNVLTDTPYQKAADDAIETIAPSGRIVTETGDVYPATREAANTPTAKPKTDGIVRRPNARIVDDTVEPGMDGPLTKTLDEIGTAKLAPEDEAIIGADDALFPEFKPSGIERTEIPGSGLEGAQQNMFTGEFSSAGVTPDVPHVNAQVQLDGTLAPAQRDLGITEAPAPPDNFVPTKLRPVTNEWEQKALAAVKDKPMKDRAEILDKLQAELSGDLRKLTTEGSAANESVRARDRVVYALDQQNKAKVSESIDDWRTTNYEDLDAIKATAKSSWGEKWIGGALKNKLADTLTLRGRELDMHLQSQGYTFEEAKDMVERELANYINSRMARGIDSGNKDAILEHALTALHMGDFRPTIDGVNVPKGTGDVAKWIEASRTGNSVLKNMFFGIADVGAILGNAVPAMMTQGIPLGLGYLNRVLKLVDLEDALKNKEFSSLAAASAQDVMNANDGTALYWLGRAAGDNNLGKALIASDKPFTKWNEVLTKAQFDMLMTKGLRQPAYEGNLVLLKLLGRDINDVKVQRAAARMANAATSTAPLARGNTRRAAEGATLGSARYLRAQGDLLLAATKLINPKASMDERIIAMSAIVSIAAVAAGARELAGERLDLTPMKDGKFNPNFGNITLPDGTTMSFFGQKQLAETIMKSAMGLDDVVKKGDASAITDAWSRFMVNRVGPAPSMALKGIAKTGYDPTTNKYSFPWEGEGFGSGMSPVQHALNMLPIPVGIMGFVNSDGTPLSKGLNFLGAGSYPEGDYSAALKKYGVDSMEEFEKLDPDTFMTRKEKLYQENPELRSKFADTASTRIAESKVANSEKFMETKQTTGDWRETKDDLANQAKGAYNELGLEEKERPSTPGSAQWLWDYNNTFKLALEDPDNSSSEMNDEILGKLQADFWAKHPDPKVRKEILQYQILRAPTEADKMYARDMARLNGFDPDTGETLKIPGTDQPMPNYFNMDRYFWTEVPNDEAKQFDTKFNKWKLKQSDKVRDLTRAKQIDLYLATEDEASTRFNGKEWTPAAIKDVKNYGLPSKEDPIYSEYKQIMLPELLWFKPEQYWDNIKEAHDNRE